MADLMELAEFREFIDPKDDHADDGVLQSLLDTLEELLEEETGQQFTADVTIVDEPHDGTGYDILYLDREPISLTAAIKVGQDSASPDTTIAQTDVVVDRANTRLIYKNGYRFPTGRRNLFVSYTAATNLPNLAKLAVKEAGAFIYRRRGREHVTGDSLGEFGNITLLSSRLMFLPIWQQAIAKLHHDIVV